MTKTLNWERIHSERRLNRGKPRIKTFSAEQFNVLDKIATSSGMDCWFCIKQHIRGKHAGEDYIYDLENREQISLKRGVSMLVDGMSDYDRDLLTSEELDVLETILIYI